MWFKKFFGSSGSNTELRSLQHPRDLLVGDIVELGLLPQSSLRNKKFEVMAVNAYDFSGKLEPSWLLHGEDNAKVFLSLDKEQSDTIALSVLCSRQQVGEIFTPTNFAAILAPGVGQILTAKHILPALREWLAPSYTKITDALQGYYHSDYDKNQKNPQQDYTDAATAEGFDYYFLEGQDSNYGLEIEVYDGGETEVSLILYHDLRAISSMWPHAHNATA